MPESHLLIQLYSGNIIGKYPEFYFLDFLFVAANHKQMLEHLFPYPLVSISLSYTHANISHVMLFRMFLPDTIDRTNNSSFMNAEKDK